MIFQITFLVTAAMVAAINGAVFASLIIYLEKQYNKNKSKKHNKQNKA